MRFLPLLGYLAVIAVNTLAVTLPLGGKSISELSDQYPVLFTPIGFTFSIWSLIYTLLGVFAVYSIFHTGKVKSLITPFLISCGWNIAWLFAWHYEQVGSSLLIMLALLSSLILLYRSSSRLSMKNWREYLALHLPFSIYLGWISVATLANLTIFLDSIGIFQMIDEVISTILMILLAGGLGLMMVVRKYDIPYALVIIWAMIGIIAKRVEIDPIEYQSIIWTAGGVIGVIIVGLSGRLLQRRKVV